MAAVIEEEYLTEYYSVIVQKGWSKKKGIYSKRYLFKEAGEGVASDPHVNFQKRKTMLALSESPLSSNLGAGHQLCRLFSRIGYNAIRVVTTAFTHEKYAVTARLAKAVGNATALFIRDLMARGLDPKDLVVVGGSLGAHYAGFAGKQLHRMTGRKIGHIIAIDPSGLCFRHANPEDRLSPSDADFVQAAHFNMFGFGMEAPVGHVDFYINGGVYQTSWFAPFPCLSLCSHVRAFEVFYYTINYSGNFHGVKCNSVHQAIVAKCFDNVPEVTNTIGLSIDKNLTGIFYVPTFHIKPYFSMDYRKDIVSDFLERVNANDTVVIGADTSYGYDYATDIARYLQNGYDRLKKFDYSSENCDFNEATTERKLLEKLDLWKNS